MSCFLSFENVARRQRGRTKQWSGLGKSWRFSQPLTAGVGCLALEVMRQCENLLLSQPRGLHELPACHSYRWCSMSGKTTVAYRLAAILGYGCLSTDDLGEAIRAVTTKDSHPHLHPMDGYDYREYYGTRSPDALIADVSLEHRALWPAVERVIRKHATWAHQALLKGGVSGQSGSRNYGCPACARCGSWPRADLTRTDGQGGSVLWRCVRRSGHEGHYLARSSGTMRA